MLMISPMSERSLGFFFIRFYFFLHQTNVKNSYEFSLLVSEADFFLLCIVSQRPRLLMRHDHSQFGRNYKV